MAQHARKLPDVPRTWPIVSQRMQTCSTSWPQLLLAQENSSGGYHRLGQAQSDLGYQDPGNANDTFQGYILKSNAN